MNRLAIHLPPRRERREDIALIAEGYLTGLRAAHGRPEVSFSADARRALEAHDWPENVRELEGVVLRAFVEAGPGPITAEHLELGSPARLDANPELVFADGLPLHEAVRKFEAELIQAAVAQHSRLSDAARALGIDQKTLYLKRTRLGLG